MHVHELCMQLGGGEEGVGPGAEEEGGDRMPGLADLHLLDQLLHFMNGGLKRETSARATAGPSHLVLVW